MGLDRAALEALRQEILAGGTGELTVDELRGADLAELAWSGDPEHLRSVSAALDRAARGLEDYLAVRAPSGQPIAKVRIEYASEDDAGVLSQLATMGELQGLGIATMLIGAAEQYIRGRGLTHAALGVEDGNPRARRLYERLGYEACGRQPASWPYQDDDGVLRRYETTLTIMRKRL
jgi:ribosomal protein S18 acetylase RimI-like enzyme